VLAWNLPRSIVGHPTKLGASLIRLYTPAASARPKKDEMTPEEKELMDALCKRIAVEQDPKKFDELVFQLNELLEKKEHRLKPDQREKPS
jgi:hypothetical protein